MHSSCFSLSKNSRKLCTFSVKFLVKKSGREYFLTNLKPVSLIDCRLLKEMHCQKLGLSLKIGQISSFLQDTISFVLAIYMPIGIIQADGARHRVLLYFKSYEVHRQHQMLECLRSVRRPGEPSNRHSVFATSCCQSKYRPSSSPSSLLASSSSTIGITMTQLLLTANPNIVCCDHLLSKFSCRCFVSRF